MNSNTFHWSGKPNALGSRQNFIVDSLHILRAMIVRLRREEHAHLSNRLEDLKIKELGSMRGEVYP